ncbi:MAG: hypothetical protein MUE85_21155 [Microscillaceae bacterium]|nr:hypothetical protein [Microscillaceae bacterium]
MVSRSGIGYANYPNPPLATPRRGMNYQFRVLSARMTPLRGGAGGGLVSSA